MAITLKNNVITVSITTRPFSTSTLDNVERIFIEMAMDIIANPILPIILAALSACFPESLETAIKPENSIMTPVRNFTPLLISSWFKLPISFITKAKVPIAKAILRIIIPALSMF